MISFADSRARLSIVSALLGAASILCARAQVVDFQKERAPIVEIHGLWRFHTGDDPDGKLGWANPNFDDSTWKLLRSDQHINVQGYPAYSGMAWYRFKVLLSANHPPMALYIPAIGTSYQVFAGGRLIGQFGGMPPHQRALLYHSGGSIGQVPRLGRVLSIPDEIPEQDGSVVIAIRVWTWSDWASLLETQAFQPLSIGDAGLLQALQQDRANYLFWSLSSENVLALGYLLATLAGLGLFLLRPGELEYLWFAGFEASNAVNSWSDVYLTFHPLWFQGYMVLSGLLTLSTIAFILLFFVTLLKQRRSWLFWSAMGSGLFGSVMYLPLAFGWMSVPVWLAVIYPVFVPCIVFQLLMLWLPARRGNLDARLLLGPFGLQYGVILGDGLIAGLDAFGLGGPAVKFLAGKLQQIFDSPFPIAPQDIANYLCQLSLLAILILRFARTRRDEERFKSELEAARTVQQVLIPEEIPAIPGFGLECIYRPAGQVGGDFFQILPTPAGGALIVIGDVSGKGMPAAMAVSLLVGTVRTLAHYTQSPAEILNAMNQRMLARSKDGFTTCLILHIDPTGAATLANAGHLAPYRAAQELSVDYGLPLGITAESVYTESTFRLDEGHELTLLTDGVAEARAKTGELFGFERTASISILSAQHIAATAAAFGQQDDITVLKIRRTPLPEPADERVDDTVQFSPSAA